MTALLVCLPGLCRLRATFFGLAPEGCTAAECGDRTVEAPVAPAGQAAQLTATVAYPKPGRYVVRVEVRRGGARSCGHLRPVSKWNMANAAARLPVSMRAPPASNTLPFLLLSTGD